MTTMHEKITPLGTPLRPMTDEDRAVVTMAARIYEGWAVNDGDGDDATYQDMARDAFSVARMFFAEARIESQRMRDAG